MAVPYCSLFLWLNLCFFSVLGSQVDDVSVAHVYADVGSNVSLPCLPQSLRSNTEGYTPSVGENSLFIWIREGKTLQHSRVEENGILTLTKITRTDAGLYTCQAEESFGYSEGTFTRNVAQVELHVKSIQITRDLSVLEFHCLSFKLFQQHLLLQHIWQCIHHQCWLWSHGSSTALGATQSNPFQ